jgi:triosephosphate isomerase
MARRPLIAGNWKMNCLKADGLALARGLAARIGIEATRAADVVICPPAGLVESVARAVAGSVIGVGGQDCHTVPKGAHTGDISAAMLKDLGASHVIVGHSERRKAYGESDALIRAKAEAAHAAGLVSIICIGETEAERLDGRTLEVVGGQFAGVLPGDATPDNTVIAYEPVWAIGTGRTPTDEEVAEVHHEIRALAARHLGAEVAAKLRILYGGSMNAANARQLLALEDVDGGLIGGASLQLDGFWTIIESCA